VWEKNISAKICRTATIAQELSLNCCIFFLQICMDKSNYYDPQELSMETFAAAQLKGLLVHRI
jgi:hypothetical protein